MRTPLLEIYAKFRIIVALKAPVRSATVLLYSIVAMVGGANSYRQMNESSASIASLSRRLRLECVMRRLTRACGSSCTASIPAHWRAPFGPRVDAREPPATEGLRAIAVDGKPCAAASTPFATARPRI